MVKVITTDTGDEIMIHLSDDGRPTSALKVTGGIGQYISRLRREFPMPDGLEWRAASDVLAYPVKMGWQ